MAIGVDNEYGALQTLTSVNMISRLGGTDDTVNNNATVTLLAEAIEALAPVAGAAPDANRQVAIGLKRGVLAGVLAETHTYTTITGMAAGVAAYIDDLGEVATTFDSYLAP